MSHSDFWQDSKKAREENARLKELKRNRKGWESIRADLEGYKEFIFEESDLAIEKVAGEGSEKLELEKLELEKLIEEESSILLELSEAMVHLEREFGELEQKRMLNDPNDRNSVFLTINAGAGGTEACDWAHILKRMYVRWSEVKGYKWEEVDTLLGEEAGIKHSTLLVQGDFAYGFLKGEIGVHRLVRISPFDSGKRRHTSFASVYVLPEVQDDIEIELLPKDLKIDTYRAQGAGGQHVNTTDSAVRITHIPTRIVVQCQNDRSQHKNKDNALKVLRSRLYEHYEKERKEEVEQSNPQKTEIAWGNQIRSYVFQPYILVKDHRTGWETSDLEGVLEGRTLDSCMDAFLRWNLAK